MITSTLVTSTSTSVPVKVFTSTTTGAALNPPSVVGQKNALTTTILCNTGAATLSDETANAVQVSIYLVKYGHSYGTSSCIISNLVVPAGETVFLSEERIVLDEGDEIWVGTNVANLLAVTVSTLPV